MSQMLIITTIIILLVICGYSECITSEECQKSPWLLKDRYCIIEYASRNRWPHTNRYFYEWASRSCRLVRWAEYCAPPAAQANNFASEAACEQQCAGWA